MTIRRFPDGPPQGLFELEPRALLRTLEGPTWLRIPGTGDAPARAICTLLHGDEPTGLLALRHVLPRLGPLPHDLHVVIFNVEAALADGGFAHRYLAHQEDGNRLWSNRTGRVPHDHAGRAAAQAILGELLAEPLDLLVDVHNTTGDNPFHAIVPSLDIATIELATRFTTTLLHWRLGNGTLMEEVTPYAPAIAVECGLPDRAALSFAVDGIRRLLGTPLGHPGIIPDHDLVGEMCRVTLAPGVRARFGGVLDDEVDLVLPIGGDAVNLTEVAPGHVLGHARPGAPRALVVTDADGRDITDALLEVTADGTIRTCRPQVPVMVVRTVEAALKDCLCYLASALPRSAAPYPDAASSAGRSSPPNRSSSSSGTATSLRRTS